MECMYCGTDDQRNFEEPDVCVFCDEEMEAEKRRLQLEEEFSSEEIEEMKRFW